MKQAISAKATPSVILLSVLLVVSCSQQKATDRTRTTDPLGTQTDARNDDLINAAKNGDLARVKALVAAGGDVNAKDILGSTALGLASQNGQLEVVQALIAAKADVNATEGNGKTALMEGAANGQLEVVQALIAAKADVNATDSLGSTALQYASQAGHSREVEQLLVAANRTARGTSVALPSSSGGAVPENSGRAYITNGKGDKTCFTSVCDPKCHFVSVPC